MAKVDHAGIPSPGAASPPARSASRLANASRARSPGDRMCYHARIGRSTRSGSRRLPARVVGASRPGRGAAAGAAPALGRARRCEMEPSDYLAAIEADAAGLADAARAGPDWPTPSCPGWTAGHLLVHVGRAYRWLAEIAATRATTPVPIRP